MNEMVGQGTNASLTLLVLCLPSKNVPLREKLSLPTDPVNTELSRCQQQHYGLMTAEQKIHMSVGVYIVNMLINQTDVQTLTLFF